MKYQEWLNGCGCCPDIQDCPPSTGNPCDCDSILLELSKQHTDDLVLQDEIDNLDEKKLDASAYTPDEYATEEWVNEQGFLKTVEPLKTINGESLIGEGNIVISGGSGDAYTKAETDALLDEKQNVLNAGDYITIDSANTISTSGLVTVEDNEVEEYPVLTSDIYNPSDANFNVTSYDDAADVFELIITGPTFEYFDVSNSRFVFINESGETTADISGIYGFSTSGAVYPTRIQEYVNLDLYEYHTTDRYNVHLKYSCKNGWRLKRFYLYIASGYEEGVEFKTYQNYPALQSADAISENVYPALEKLTANKFDKDFTCNDPLLYEAAYKRFRIKTSNQNNNTISASTSATTNLARSYDVKTYVSEFTYDKDTIDNKIAGGGTFDPTLYYKKSETSGKTEIQNALDLKLDASAFTESDYYKKSETSGKTELDAEFDKYYEKDETSGKTELSNEFALYYKKSETSSKTEIDDALDNYYEKSETSGKTELSNEFALYYKKSETSGKTELDAAFSAITKTIDDNEQAVSEALNDLDDNKQDKLTAGTGIDITNNVISATGGGVSYSAGTGIDITNNVISSTLNAYNGTGVGSLIIGQSANTASGDYSVAVGAQTEALGGRSFAQGLSGKTTNTAEITFGQLNDTKNAYAGFGHSGNTLFTVGNGAGIDGSTTDYARHNAFEIRSNGDIYIPEPSKVNPSHYYQAPMIKLQDRLNEIDNKPNIWCGSESQWSQISGSTQQNTLYLVY